MKEDGQVLNVVTDNDETIGYLTFLLEEKKMYVYGHLEKEGVSEDFRDLVKPYLKGLTNIEPDLEIISYLSVGGRKIELEDDK